MKRSLSWRDMKKVTKEQALSNFKQNYPGVNIISFDYDPTTGNGFVTYQDNEPEPIKAPTTYEQYKNMVENGTFNQLYPADQFRANNEFKNQYNQEKEREKAQQRFDIFQKMANEEYINRGLTTARGAADVAAYYAKKGDMGMYESMSKVHGVGSEKDQQFINAFYQRYNENMLKGTNVTKGTEFVTVGEGDDAHPIPLEWIINRKRR